MVSPAVSRTRAVTFLSTHIVNHSEPCGEKDMGSVQTGSVWSSGKPFAGGVGGGWKKGHILSSPLFVLNLLKEKSVAAGEGETEGTSATAGVP